MIFNFVNFLWCKTAYQTGKSVGTAHVDWISFVKKGMKNRGIALAGLFDVDGAFNHTFNIREYREWHRGPPNTSESRRRARTCRTIAACVSHSVSMVGVR